MKLSLDAFLSDVEKRLKAIDAPCEHRAAKRCTGCLAERSIEFVEGQDVAGLVAVVRAVMKQIAHTRKSLDYAKSQGARIGNMAYQVHIEDLESAMESAVPNV
jgi:hypothetical protein